MADTSQLSKWQLNRSGPGAPITAPVEIPDVLIGNTPLQDVFISGSTIAMYSSGETTISAPTINITGEVTITGGLSGTTGSQYLTVAALLTVISGQTAISGITAALAAL